MPENGERAIANPNSGLVWEYIRTGDKFEEQMHHSMSSVVISKGLLMTVDFSGLFHCLDAKREDIGRTICWPRFGDRRSLSATKYLFAMRMETSPYSSLGRIRAARTLGSDFARRFHLFHPGLRDGVLYVANRTTLYAVDAELTRKEIDHSAYWPQGAGQIATIVRATRIF